MNGLLELLAGENKEIYIMGDMNIDLLKLNEHWKTGEYVENIFTHGFIPLITKPTRITDHSATLIDHIYTNRTDTNMTSGIIMTDISDHFGIFTCFGRARNNNTHIETDTKSRTYVVKTYPSIDPIVAPPDIINIHKCHRCTHERSYGTTLVTGYI